MDTKEISLKLEVENREAIKFLYNKGLSVKQIRYIRYNQIDKDRMVLFFEDSKGRKRKIKLKSTPVEPLLERPPISRLYFLYRKTPYRNFQRKLPILLQPECFYSIYDIERICGKREALESNNSPIFLQRKNRGELLKEVLKIR